MNLRTLAITGLSLGAFLLFVIGVLALSGFEGQNGRPILLVQQQAVPQANPQRQKQGGPPAVPVPAPAAITAIQNAVLQHLKETLDDPTVNIVRWGAVVPVRSAALAIRLRFRTKNRLGALTLQDLIFKVEDGHVVLVSDSRYGVTTDSLEAIWLQSDYTNAAPIEDGGGVAVPAQAADLRAIVGPPRPKVR